MKPTVYVVLARRWADENDHAYVVGAYSKKHAALKAAQIEESYRGGKYGCEVTEWVLDAGIDGRIKSQKTVKRAEDFVP